MKCDEQAVFRYTWAGENENYCCLNHATKIKAIAQAIGYYVQFIPLEIDQILELSCQQEVKDKE